MIAKQISYIWSNRQSRYILLRRLSINWTGPIALCKGASSGQTDIAGTTKNLTDTLAKDYSTQFAGQQSILGTLNNSLSSIIAKGPNQMGYSQEELDALNSQSEQGTGQQYDAAKKALAEQQAAQGGGNTLLPSGVAAQQQAKLASAAANQTSSQLLSNKIEGYKQGNAMYNSAVSGLGGVAQMMNPTAYAGEAGSTSKTAFNEQTAVDNANNAANPWTIVGGVAGGMLGGALGPAGAALGSQLGAGIAGGVTNSGGGGYI